MGLRSKPTASPPRASRPPTTTSGRRSGSQPVHPGFVWSRWASGQPATRRWEATLMAIQ
jgi:hypothetical protein